MAYSISYVLSFETQQALKNAEKAARKMESTMGKAAKTVGAKMNVARSALGGTADKMASLQKRATAVGTKLRGTMITVAASMALPLKSMIAFDSAMKALESISGASAEQMKVLKNQALDLGATTQWSASAVAEGQTKLAMAGLSTQKILIAMPGLLDTATAAMVDLGTASDVVTNVVGAFRLSVAEIPRVSDAMVAGTTRFNTTFGELTEAIKYSGGAFGAFQQSVETNVALIGALADVGVKGSMAGTALANAVTSIAKPSASAARTLDKFGISTKNADGSMVNMIDVLEQMRNSGMAAEDMFNVFDKRVARSLVTFLDANKNFDELRDKMSGIAGLTGEIVSVQMESFVNQWKIFYSALEGIFLKLGSSGVLGHLRWILNIGTSILGIIKNWEFVFRGVNLVFKLMLPVLGIMAGQFIYMKTQIVIATAKKYWVAMKLGVTGASRAVKGLKISLKGLKGALSGTGMLLVFDTLARLSDAMSKGGGFMNIVKNFGKTYVKTFEDLTGKTAEKERMEKQKQQLMEAQQLKMANEDALTNKELENDALVAAEAEKNDPMKKKLKSLKEAVKAEMKMQAYINVVNTSTAPIQTEVQQAFRSLAAAGTDNSGSVL